MNYRLIHQLPPTEGNPRNSEGAFLRGKKGEILFAYSRYHGESNHDHASCDIYMITSYDEGESWSEPRPIALASEFGTQNIMSVSAMEQQNGDLAFYFLIKENDRTTTIGRTVSKDGGTFVSERCECNFTPAYYVINNDRLVRLSNGRLVAPAAGLKVENGKLIYGKAVLNFFVSEDDGKTFEQIHTGYTTPSPWETTHGLQEPGLIEVEEKLFCWCRTKLYCQYEAWSESGLAGFGQPQAGQFTSPASPMQIKKIGGSYSFLIRSFHCSVSSSDNPSATYFAPSSDIHLRCLPEYFVISLEIFSLTLSVFSRRKCSSAVFSCIFSFLLFSPPDVVFMSLYVGNNIIPTSGEPTLRKRKPTLFRPGTN